jgi:nuclear pore complex protein Nup155
MFYVIPSHLSSDDIPLVKRIEYLARGVMCIRSDTVGFSAQNGVFLKDLEDKVFLKL